MLNPAFAATVLLVCVIIPLHRSSDVSFHPNPPSRTEIKSAVMSQPEEIRSIIWEELTNKGLDENMIKELKSSMSSRSSQPSSSPVKNSGIRKMSLTKSPSGSPLKRASQRSISNDLRSSTSQETYTFDFGKHGGETIYEVMVDDPGYFEWMFSPAATTLLDSRPLLVEGLRALPSAYLNAHSSLRDLMKGRNIYPFDLEQSAIQIGRNAECRFWQATQRDIVRDSNTGPDVTMEDLDALFEGRPERNIVSFTGVIVRIEAPLGDYQLEQPYSYTIIPSGWSRKTTMQMAFHNDDEYGLDENKFQDMLYQPFRVFGEFRGSGLSQESFKPHQNPEPAEVKSGICWKVTGSVSYSSCETHLEISYRVLRISTSYFRSTSVYVEDEGEEFIEDKGAVYCFEGIIRASDCDGNFRNARYIAEQWEQIAKSEE